MLLIDGDIVAYRCSFSSEDESDERARKTTDDFLYGLITDAYVALNSEGPYKVYLTGDGNFRYEYAVTVPYKGNRKSNKPKHLYTIRDHLMDSWDAIMVEGEEADDAIAYAAEGDPNAVIVSIDKDFLQCAGYHFNMNSRELTTVSEVEGLRSFYRQMLTGDRVDNIQGLHGVGPKKASKLIDDLTTEQEMYQCVLSEYEKRGETKERVTENGRLLWLRRYPEQIWTPPEQEDETN